MNYLSHFYFDRYNDDPYFVLGTVMPDLLKDADKSAQIRPEKTLIQEMPVIEAMIAGWKRHLKVDIHFHSSDFFRHHSHQLKLHLSPIIEDSPVKPFFLGHIALELLIDGLLIHQNEVEADQLYLRLEQIDNSEIERFLNLHDIADAQVFLRFYDGFKKSRYLSSYAKITGIVYALQQICKRVWLNPFDEYQVKAMEETLSSYQHEYLADSFMEIFDEIENQL
jgi:hypothetical protein